MARRFTPFRRDRPVAEGFDPTALPEDREGREAVRAARASTLTPRYLIQFLQRTPEGNF
jgi:hypothetical protein